jgi:hypothetical protein
MSYAAICLSTKDTSEWWSNEKKSVSVPWLAETGIGKRSFLEADSTFSVCSNAESGSSFISWLFLGRSDSFGKGSVSFRTTLVGLLVNWGFDFRSGYGSSKSETVRSPLFSLISINALPFLSCSLFCFYMFYITNWFFLYLFGDKVKISLTGKSSF